MEATYCTQCAEPLRQNHAGKVDYCHQCDLEFVNVNGITMIKEGDSSLVPSTPNDGNTKPPSPSGY